MAGKEHNLFHDRLSFRHNFFSGRIRDGIDVAADLLPNEHCCHCIWGCYLIRAATY